LKQISWDMLHDSSGILQDRSYSSFTSFLNKKMIAKQSQILLIQIIKHLIWNTREIVEPNPVFMVGSWQIFQFLNFFFTCISCIHALRKASETVLLLWGVLLTETDSTETVSDSNKLVFNGNNVVFRTLELKLEDRCRNILDPLTAAVAGFDEDWSKLHIFLAL